MPDLIDRLDKIKANQKPPLFQLGMLYCNKFVVLLFIINLIIILSFGYFNFRKQHKY